jgi:hypothetical protein
MPQGRVPNGDERPRFITLTQAEAAAVQSYRLQLGATTRGQTIGGPDLMRDVVFAACRPDEVAWEVDGQGEFTRHACAVLGPGADALTNEQFAQQVVQAFGATPRQHPMLDCAAAAKSRRLLQP